MPAQEIPREEWPAFFNMFSELHDGRPVTLELFSPEIGAQKIVRELALEGISTDVVETDNDTIEIMLGADMDDHITHLVEAPLMVWLEQTHRGDDSALEIEAEDGAKTLLRFE